MTSRPGTKFSRLFAIMTASFAMVAQGQEPLVPKSSQSGIAAVLVTGVFKAHRQFPADFQEILS
jgi:hypothetical protein